MQRWNDRSNDYNLTYHNTPPIALPLWKLLIKGSLPVQPDHSHLEPDVCLTLAKADQGCFRLLVRNYRSHVLIP